MGGTNTRWGFPMVRALPCLLLSVLACSASFVAGCQTPRNAEAEKFGKTFYLDGAGNWGFGAAEVPSGLKEAGYTGDVEIYIWTTSFSPFIDQLNQPAARLRARALADRIKKYAKMYPLNQLNIISLSAGTGVATWAVEDIGPDVKIHNLVLLGSSLSHDYDMTRALKNMTGRVFVYHSSEDAILAGVRMFVTIDGKSGVDSAGLVGMRKPRGMADRIVNIPWSRKYQRYGWTGSHTDCTNKIFVREVISRHILTGSTTREAKTTSDRISTTTTGKTPPLIGPRGNS